MGRRKEKSTPRSHTLPSSPTHSSSSSDFEFTISLSPRKSSTTLCPADELFYKGQLLPLHLSPRLSMVRTLLSSSSTSSSSADTTTTASRDSTGSSTDSHSSFSSDLLLLASGDGDSSGRPSSVTADEDDPFNRLNKSKKISNKYFSLSRFSSVFRKESKARDTDTGPGPGSSVKRAREVIRKYLKKAKPFYEILSQKQKMMRTTTMMSPNKCFSGQTTKVCLSVKNDGSTIKSSSNNNGGFSHSFSGNLRYPRRRNYVSSCPSSMMSSPCHSGILYRNGPGSGPVAGIGAVGDTTSSSMEELQSAIQGAIAHCKNSMVQNNKIMVSNEI